MTNPMLSLLVRTIGSALAVGAFLLLIYAPSAQAQAPNSGVTINGTLVMSRSDGPQIQLNDTRFPERGPAVTMRGASASSSTGIIVLERAGGPGSTYVILQPVGAVGTGTGVLVYGVGGLGNPCSTNITTGYNNTNPPYYLFGTSTAGGECSPYAPLWFWNMNHVAFRFDRDAGGTPYIRVNDYVAFDDSNLPVAEPSARLEMSRLRKATALQEGLSWPIVWNAPTWYGDGQAVKMIRQEAFGTTTGGVNAPYGVRYLDNEGKPMLTVRSDGTRLGGPLLFPVQSEPTALAGGIQVFTKDNAGLLSLCAKFPNGQVKCFVLQD